MEFDDGLEMIEKNNYHCSLLYGALIRNTFRCSQRASNSASFFKITSVCK